MNYYILDLHNKKYFVISQETLDDVIKEKSFNDNYTYVKDSKESLKKSLYFDSGIIRDYSIIFNGIFLSEFDSPDFFKISKKYNEIKNNLDSKGYKNFDIEIYTNRYKDCYEQ